MKKTFFISLLLAIKLLPVFAQGDWKLRTEKQGIKIYTSTVADSKIKAIKVECEFNATVSQFVAVIMDVKTAPDWVYGVKSCILIKQVSVSELYYYSEINMPWPVANRDFVSHLTVSENPQTKIVTIDGPAVPGFVPVKKGIVRISESESKWVITPLAADQIKVEYAIHVDPGGSLPTWLVNTFASQVPFKIFSSLKVQLKKKIDERIAIASAPN